MNKNTGWAIHCHHGVLMEHCYDYDGRVKCINQKPKHEIEIRLRLFKLLPKEALKDVPKKWFQDTAKLYQDAAKWKQGEANRYQDAAKGHQDLVKGYQDLFKWYQDLARQYQDLVKRHQGEAKWFQGLANQYQDLAENAGEGLSDEEFHKKWCGCKEWNGKEIVFPKEGKR